MKVLILMTCLLLSSFAFSAPIDPSTIEQGSKRKVYKPKKSSSWSFASMFRYLKFWGKKAKKKAKKCKRVDLTNKTTGKITPVGVRCKNRKIVRVRPPKRKQAPPTRRNTSRGSYSLGYPVHQ